jgi:glucosylceramidase
MRSFLTAEGTAYRLTSIRLPSTTADMGAPVSLWVDPGRSFQTMLGFGGAFTEAAARTWLALSRPQQDAVLRACFDSTTGHGYTVCRVHMNSCDFSLSNYAHAATPGDTILRDFSIARDEQALLPFIQAAQRVARAPLHLLVSPWSPPAWMKSNRDMNRGGHLLPEYRDAWANCYVRFIQAYAEHGVPVWGVSVQNEPAATQRWDSCIYSAEEERDFVRDHLGPSLAAAGLGHVKILIWDHNRDLMVERAGTVYADAEAAKYVWGTGFHWYGEDHFDHVQLVHDAWPDKNLLFTEGCQEGGPHAGSWALGERYAKSMINDINRWTVGCIDWNLLLNQHGGPNHVGNYCSAPILVDTEQDRFECQSSYFYIGHFARFVKPGARRILCATSREALEATAFFNPDGGVVIVALNRTAQPLPFALNVGSSSSLAALPARSIATLLLP